MRKYIETIKIIVTNNKNYKFLIMSYAFRLIRVLLLIAIWQQILSPEKMDSGLTLLLVLKYTLIVEVFSDFLNIRSGFIEELCYGSVISRFLRPVNIFEQIAVETLSSKLINFIFFSIPLLFLAPLLGIDPFPAHIQGFLLFLVSLILAIYIGLLIDFLFSAFTISLEQSMDVVNQVRSALVLILSGAFIPLALLPWGIGGVIEYLPFASLASAPLNIYIGTGNPCYLIALQVFWAIILTPLTAFMWKKNREKIISYGG